MVRFLKQISDHGIKVFVIPGNLDINKPEAVAYNGNSTYMLSAALYNVPAEYVPDITPLLRNAFMAHYAGNEHITTYEQA